jgi:hypothetical protein
MFNWGLIGHKLAELLGFYRENIQINPLNKDKLRKSP